MVDRGAVAAAPPKPFIPYGRQSIDDDDIRSVVDCLQSDWLTTGPGVGAFEAEFAKATGAAHAVAVNSGTAALHSMMFALGIGSNDEVIVPSLTFAASANSVVFQGGTPLFADVDPDTLLIDAKSVERLISPRTRAILAVDYGGQACDYDALRDLANAHGLSLVSDACHSLGGTDKGRPVGTLADMSAFSFHPVKHITSGEGGAVTTQDEAAAGRMRSFRNHGITTDHRQREISGSWAYEMVELGYNYRLTDFQCALASSQLRKLARWVELRKAIASKYDAAFSQMDGVTPLVVRPDVSHAYHLYVVKIDVADRGKVFAHLRSAGIGANVHYVPVHLHPFYRTRFGTTVGQCPVAEAAYQQILSLPMFPRLSEDDTDRVIAALGEALSAAGA